MKQFFIAVISITLLGCAMRYEDVQKQEAKCRAIGGVPSYHRLPGSGEVTHVYCTVNGLLYKQGNY